MDTPLLALRGICTSFRTANGTVDALADVSIEAVPGEFIAVQGPSGCGKTTMLLTAGGLLAPDSGRVEVEGVEPYALSPDDRARFRAVSIGFVFQQFHLVPYLSVFDNILAPCGAYETPDARTRAGELMERFNLTGRAHHLPSELSTGERQRTALARALLNKPRILLADEPTGNLDHDNAGVALETFASFAAAGGVVLLATHDDRIASSAHRTVRLSGGRLV